MEEAAKEKGKAEEEPTEGEETKEEGQEIGKINQFWREHFTKFALPFTNTTSGVIALAPFTSKERLKIPQITWVLPWVSDCRVKRPGNSPVILLPCQKA